ncbi:MAG: hypothetical protein WA854_16070 [Candidatus Binataceae bacterium]
MNGDLQGSKVTQISGQQNQIVRGRRRGNSKISESGALALAARPIRESAGNTSGWYVERQHAAAVEVQQSFQPLSQASGFATSALAEALRYSAFDLGYADRRQEQTLRVAIHPFD